MGKAMKNNKKNLSIIAATGMTIFSLLAVFSSTIAWFALNKNVDGSAATIRANADGNALTLLTVHRCIINESSTTQYKFDSNPAISVGSEGNIPATGTTPSSQTFFRIDDYSSLNKSQPVLLLLHLASGTKSSDVAVNASTGITYSTYANAGGNGYFLVDSTTVTQYPFSFISNFMSGQFTSSDFNFTVQTSSLTQSSKFVQMTNGNITGLSSSISMFQGSGNTAIRYVAIVMNYDEAAIQFLISKNMNNQAITNNGNKIDYYCDWNININATIDPSQS